MFHWHYLLFAFLAFFLRSQRSLADGDFCDCHCADNLRICDSLKKLETLVDANTADRNKWSSHFQFIKHFHNRWREEILKLFEEAIEKLQPRQNEPLKNPEPQEPSVLIIGPKALSGDTIRKSGIENKISDFEERMEIMEKITEQMKNHLKKDQATSEMIESISMTVSTVETQNQELKDKISGIEAALHVATNRAEKLHQALNKEKEARKLFENIYRGQQLNLKKQKKSQTDKIFEIEGKLSAVEEAAETLESDLKKEKESNYKFKNDVVEIQNRFRISGEENHSAMLRELENKVNSLEIQLDTVDHLTSNMNNAILKEEVIRQKIQTSILKMQSAQLEAAKILKRVLPTDVSKDYMRELNVTLDISGHNWRQALNPKSVYQFLNVTNGVTGTSPEDIEDMKERMTILNDTVEKALSNIKALEDKYKDSLKSRTGYGTEIREPHGKAPGRRPFDPHRDP